jgi:hypothetical protein
MVIVDDDPDVAARLGVSILSARVLDADVSPASVAHPVVDARPGARVLVLSSNASFVDVDGDGKASQGDAFGPFALVVQSPDDRVIVGGGADVAHFAPTSARVIVESPRSDPLALAAVDVSSQPWLGALVGVGIAAAGLAPLVRRSLL